eukprot:451450-Amphidinium_carterae.2
MAQILSLMQQQQAQPQPQQQQHATPAFEQVGLIPQTTQPMDADTPMGGHNTEEEERPGKSGTTGGRGRSRSRPSS